MKEAAQIIKAVEKARGSDKLYILQKNKTNVTLKEILRFIYNPYHKTGISDKKISKFAFRVGSTECISYSEAISYFTTHTTGSDADIFFALKFINGTPDEYRWLATAIVTQDLKIGVTATSLNKVYGDDFIPKTGCMLGTLYGDVGPNKTKWPCIVTEKLDGIRRILVKENGQVRCFSRSGHEDTGLVEIVEDARYLPDNYVYDGELLAAGTFKDNIALRQATNSIANSKGIKTGLTFNVFDALPVEEFYAGRSKDNARTRKIWLGAVLGDESIQIIDDMWPQRIAAFCIYKDLKAIRTVPILGLVNNLDEAEPIVQAIWANGGEGIMLNTVSGIYEIKRSKDLLKVKHTEEHVLTVVDLMEGTGKYEDSLGALVVQYKNSYVGVGSGFTDDQRAAIWSNPKRYIGRRVEVETFGESTNANGIVSLNCPIFKRFVGEEE